MYNKIVLVGNLTRDIELKYTQTNIVAIAKSAIATSRKYKSSTGEQKEEVCFVDITFFARSAEVANQYLRKGSKVLVEGKLQLEQWVDPNGQKRSKHGVTVNMMQMLDQKTTNNHDIQNSKPENRYPQNVNTSYRQVNQSYQANDYSSQQHNEYEKVAIQNDIQEINITEDDIPF